MAKTPFESFNKFDQDNKFPHKSSRKILDDLRDDFDGVMGIVAGPGISVDSTDPSYPIVSALFPGGNGGGGSGGLWLKSVSKQNIESAENDVMYTDQTVYGGIKGLAGNVLNLHLVIAALPGSNSEGAVIQVYAVPGEFIPSDLVKIPEAIDTPVTAIYSGLIESETDGTIDHLQFTADITLTGFVDDKIQIVVLSDSGAYILLEYTQEDIAHLLTADITTPYSELAAYRTGFTAGDVVTLSFEADAPVYSILVWPFDATSYSMAWQPVEYVLPEPVLPGNTGTVNITIAVTPINALTAIYEGTLRVSASRYGQATLGIVTTSEFMFDQRAPLLPTYTTDLNYNYPGSNTAIAGSQQVAVTIGAAYANQITIFLNSEVQLVTPGPIDLVDYEATFLVERSAEDFTGRVYGTMSAINFNNGKTTTSNNDELFFFDVEGSSFNNPTISVAGNTPFVSALDPLESPRKTITLTSTVKLLDPTGHIFLPGVFLTGSWITTNDYVWTNTGYVTDGAGRGVYSSTSPVPITFPGLVTAAGSPIPDVGGQYAISGFEQRMITITEPFSPTLDTSALIDIDYAAGVTVLDIAFKPVAYTVDDVEDLITFTDPLFYNANATGTMFVYVAQTPAP